MGGSSSQWKLAGFEAAHEHKTLTSKVNVILKMEVKEKTLFLNKPFSFIDTPKILVMITGQTGYTQTNQLYTDKRTDY